MATLQSKPSKLNGEFHNNADEYHFSYITDKLAKIYICSNCSSVVDPADLDKSIMNLMIFDDIMSDRNQDPASNYFTRGRTANCDSIYLSQSYTKLPLHTVRSNANIMIFF